MNIIFSAVMTITIKIFLVLETLLVAHDKFTEKLTLTPQLLKTNNVI